MEESTSDGSSKSWTQFAHYFARCQYEPIWGAPPSTERSRSWESQSSTGSQRHWRRRELAQGPPLQQTRRQSLVVEIARKIDRLPYGSRVYWPTFGCANGEIMEAAGTAGENAQILERIRTCWWRRRESNPRPKARRRGTLHACPHLLSHARREDAAKTAGHQPRRISRPRAEAPRGHQPV